MDRRDGIANLDLDRIAAAMAETSAEFQPRGVTMATPTWLDMDATWPYTLVTDRSEISRPRSIGITFQGPGDSEGVIVVYAGGWADVDVVHIDDRVTTEYVEIDYPTDFRTTLTRVFTELIAKPPQRRSPR